MEDNNSPTSPTSSSPTPNIEQSSQCKPQPDFSITNIPITNLLISEQNVRKSAEDAKHDETNVNTLTSNIAQYGLLNPLTVCRSQTDPDKFEILAGQRRFTAVKNLNWTTVPCRIVECKNEEEAALLSFAENIQRLPMTVRDKCNAIHQLYVMHNDNAEQVSKITNLSQPTVKRYLNISENLSTSLHDQFDEKGDSKLTLGIANLLTEAVPNPEEQQQVYETIKDLATNKQKKEVLEALAKNPDSDVGELVNEIQERDVERKKVSKIKKEPWVYDNNKQPLSIPKNMYGRVFDLICTSGESIGESNASTNVAPVRKRKRQK